MEQLRVGRQVAVLREDGFVGLRKILPPPSRRGLVLIDGIVTAVLGGMLIAEWPSDSIWAIGMLFGIGMAFSAINLLTAPPSQPAS